MTKERVCKLAFDSICDLNLWGLSAKGAAKTIHYIIGICDMANRIILELDKEKEK